MADESDLEKTEEATPKRAEQARAEGQIARSRELTTFVLLMVGFGGCYGMAGDLAHSFIQVFRSAFTFDRDLSFNSALVLPKAGFLLAQGGLAIMPILAMLVAASIVTPMALGGWLLTATVLVPKFSRLDPIAGLKRMFSLNGVTLLLMALAKAGVVGGVGFLVMRHFSPDTVGLITEAPTLAMTHALHLVGVSVLWVTASMLILVIFDVPYQIWKHAKGLRMSKEEVKREFRDNEGDQMIKGKIRAQQREMARRRMMAQVPKADVIVTNPTHFAVALQYTDGEMRAPRMIAKGSDLVAARIRAIGAENNIPLIEAPPLARALYHHTELNHEIPSALYGAVAEILAWVYQLRRWNNEGGSAPIQPTEFVVPVELDSLQGRRT